MPNLREIPVGFVVERAKAQQNAQKALPYRTLIADWYASNGQEVLSYADLQEIDNHFDTIYKDEEMKMLLPDCVLPRIRNNAHRVNMLIDIVHEIHRRMNISRAESAKAKRPEDIRRDQWTWALVMRLMLREVIIAENTNKSTFGMLIEKILGNKVKPNSIRRTNGGDFNCIHRFDYDLKPFERDAYNEIQTLFIPLLKPKS